MVKPYASGIMFANAQSGGVRPDPGKFDVEFSSWVNGTDPDDATVVMCDQFPPNGQGRTCSASATANSTPPSGSP